MKVTIYFRNSKGDAVYDFDIEEFKRLANDFENYLKEGKPNSGAYMCRVIEGDTVHDIVRRIVLLFDSIAAIG
jgi:hypothetical protein